MSIILTDEQLAFLEQARADRKPIKLIAAQMGMSGTTIVRLVRKHKIGKPLSTNKKTVRRRRLKMKIKNLAA